MGGSKVVWQFKQINWFIYVKFVTKIQFVFGNEWSTPYTSATHRSNFLKSKLLVTTVAEILVCHNFSSGISVVRVVLKIKTSAFWEKIIKPN